MAGRHGCVNACESERLSLLAELARYAPLLVLGRPKFQELPGLSKFAVLCSKRT